MIDCPTVCRSAEPNCFFAAAGIEAARTTLTRTIGVEGVGLIIGPSGTGKTLLCQSLAASFSGPLSPALLASGRLCSRQGTVASHLVRVAIAVSRAGRR